MKTLIKIILLLVIPFSLLISTNISYGTDNLNTGGAASERSNSDNLSALEKIKSGVGEFISVGKGGGKGIKNSIILIARDLKNVFFMVATIYFFVITFKLIFTQNTEEESEKWKKGVIWITIGIIVMQLAYSFTQVLFDQGVGGNLGQDFVKLIIHPLILVLKTAASFIFIGYTIYTFYKIITANGDEEKIKTGKKAVVFAFIGFVIIKFAALIVESVYGRISGGKIQDAEISGFADIVVNIINWLNGFVGIAVVIMVIYVGAQVLLSAGDEEKLKKAKTAILYIAIGIAILIVNWLILTLFIYPEINI